MSAESCMAEIGIILESNRTPEEKLKAIEEVRDKYDEYANWGDDR